MESYIKEFNFLICMNKEEKRRFAKGIMAILIGGFISVLSILLAVDLGSIFLIPAPFGLLIGLTGFWFAFTTGD